MKSSYRTRSFGPAWSAVAFLILSAPAVLLGGGCSSGAVNVDGGPSGAGGASACAVSTDCAWGEIDHEILRPSDCVCLLGCPTLPLNQTTVKRRQAEHDALCNPRTNGQGQPCPVDDCVQLPALTCVDNVCTTPPAR